MEQVKSVHLFKDIHSSFKDIHMIMAQENKALMELHCNCARSSFHIYFESENILRITLSFKNTPKASGFENY